jgi:GNAT superfamily N-acetyltransferase
MDLRFREYHIRDIQQITDLWNRCLPADPITREILEDRILLDPNFELAGCRVAECDGQVVGFAHALVRRTPLPWGFESLLERDREVGWIVAIFVHDAFRRKGIGSALLGQGLDYLRASGARRAVLADYAPNYLLSGVDTEAYPGALEFFERHGFAAQGKSMGMGINLHGFRLPLAVGEIERDLAQEGIVVEHFTRDYLLPTISFLHECFPTWLSLFTDKLQRDHDLDEMVIARQGEQVIGYCQHRYWHHAERTGPFGVKAALRGKKIGTLMLYRLLERMSQKGFKFGWFAQTGERQLNFYRRVGYQVIRTQVSMIKHL